MFFYFGAKINYWSATHQGTVREEFMMRLHGIFTNLPFSQYSLAVDALDKIKVSYQVKASRCHTAGRWLIFRPASSIFVLLESPFSSLLVLKEKSQPGFSPVSQLFHCLQCPIVCNEENG
jgi:hypothetical protein